MLVPSSKEFLLRVKELVVRSKNTNMKSNEVTINCKDVKWLTHVTTNSRDIHLKLKEMVSFVKELTKV